MRSHPTQGNPPASLSRDLTPGGLLTPAALPHRGGMWPSAHRRLWRLLTRRRWTLMLSVLAVLAITLGVSLLPAPLYRSAVLLQIEPDPALEDRPAGAPAAPPRATERGAHRDSFETQCTLLQSRTLARRVIDQLDLETSETLAPTADWPLITDLAGRLRILVPSLGSAATSPDGKATAPADFEDRFLARLNVTPVGDSQLVRVAFDSPDPREAAAVVQTLAENFVTGALKRRHQATAPARAFLEHRLRRAQGELAAAERRLSAFARELGIIDLNAQRALLLERLRALDEAQSAAELTRLAPDTAIRPAGADTGAEPEGTAAVRSLEERKAALTAEYQEQSKVFKPGYPKVAQLRRELADVERQLRAQATATDSATRAETATRAQQESRLTARAEGLKAELLDLAERGNGYRVLERDLERHRRIYDGLLARLAEARAHADPGRSPVAIIDRSQIPTHPWRPNLPANLGLGAALGLIGGLLLAWVRDAVDDRVHDAATIEQQAGLPVLGRVPRVTGLRLNPAARTLALRPWQEPAGALAEAFRSLRTALLFATPAGAPRVLQFTSATAGEGKTTAACATAIAFAETGSRVLLIDANLRRPNLHRVFGLANDTGFATGFTAPDAAESPQATMIPNLWVLTAGPPPAHPAECLSSPHLDAWLEVLAPGFDHLILDGPAITDLADAVLLARQADATLLVVATGRTRLLALNAAQRRLYAAGRPPLGAVLHGSDT
jgi:polysaccharide biosynthesis transport protein